MIWCLAQDAVVYALRYRHVGVVMGQGPSGLFTILLGPYTFLAQNCIGLEPGPFRAWSLNYLSHISRPFTTLIIMF